MRWTLAESLAECNVLHVTGGRGVPDNLPRVVALGSSAPGAGKSTAEAYLATLGYQPMRIGDLVKREVSAMTEVHGVPYDEGQKEMFRALLSAWTEFRIATGGDDYWLHLAAPDGDQDLVVFSDVRYPNELAWCRRQKALTLFISRPIVPVSSLATEGRLSKDQFDYVIDNETDDGGAAMLAQISNLLRSD